MDSNNKLKYYGLTCLAAFVFFLLGGVFITGTFNIAQWSGFGRFMVVFLTAVTTIGFISAKES